jgi:hypothetical protein
MAEPYGSAVLFSRFDKKILTNGEKYGTIYLHIYQKVRYLQDEKHDVKNYFLRASLVYACIALCRLLKEG